MGKTALMVLAALAVLLVPMASALYAQPPINLQVSPDPAVPGGPLVVEYQLYGLQPYTQVETTIVMPGIINHIDKRKGSGNFYFAEQFYLPPGLMGDYPLFISIKPVGTEPIYMERVITVGRKTPSYPAEPVVKPKTEATDVSIEINAMPDVLQGGAVYYPINIRNEGEADVEVTLSIDGAQGWASYRVDPSSTIDVEAGKTEEAFIFFAVSEEAPLGSQTFTMRADYDGNSEEKRVTIAVLEKEPRPGGVPVWVYVLIIILLVLALVVIAYAIISNINKRDGEEDEDLISYY